MTQKRECRKKSVQLTNKQLHTITEQEAAEEKKMPQKYLSFGLCHFVWVTWRWTITWHLSFSGWFVRCAVFFLRLLLCSALSLSLSARELSLRIVNYVSRRLSCFIWVEPAIRPLLFNLFTKQLQTNVKTAFIQRIICIIFFYYFTFFFVRACVICAHRSSSYLECYSLVKIRRNTGRSHFNAIHI